VHCQAIKIGLRGKVNGSDAIQGCGVRVNFAITRFVRRQASYTLISPSGQFVVSVFCMSGTRTSLGDSVLV
jgi:hypothetical protein